MEIAAKYKEIEEFRSGDVGSFLRWQYGIYRSMGMTYEEFWEKDHRLTESYIKKHEMDIDNETQNNWENVSYIRAALFEVASAIHSKDKKEKSPFPKKPYPRTISGQRREKGNKLINEEIVYEMANIQDDINRRKSDDND